MNNGNTGMRYLFEGLTSSDMLERGWTCLLLAETVADEAGAVPSLVGLRRNHAGNADSCGLSEERKE
jgi:hypothetical protein